MTDKITLQFLVIGDPNPSFVEISPEKTISHLKKLIQKDRENGALKGVDAADLTLWKVRRSHHTNLEYSHLCHSPRNTYLSTPQTFSIHVFLTQILLSMPSILVP